MTREITTVLAVQSLPFYINHFAHYPYPYDQKPKFESCTWIPHVAGCLGHFLVRKIFVLNTGYFHSVSI